MQQLILLSKDSLQQPQKGLCYYTVQNAKCDVANVRLSCITFMHLTDTFILYHLHYTAYGLFSRNQPQKTLSYSTEQSQNLMCLQSHTHTHTLGQHVVPSLVSQFQQLPKHDLITFTLNEEFKKPHERTNQETMKKADVL